MGTRCWNVWQKADRIGEGSKQSRLNQAPPLLEHNLVQPACLFRTIQLPLIDNLYPYPTLILVYTSLVHDAISSISSG